MQRISGIISGNVTVDRHCLTMVGSCLILNKNHNCFGKDHAGGRYGATKEPLGVEKVSKLGVFQIRTRKRDESHRVVSAGEIGRSQTVYRIQYKHSRARINKWSHRRIMRPRSSKSSVYHYELVATRNRHNHSSAPQLIKTTVCVLLESLLAEVDH